MQNLIKKQTNDFSVALASGTDYKKGMILVSSDGGDTWEHKDLTDTDMCCILIEDINATAETKTSVGVTGEFNENEVVFHGTQTKANLGGTLQNKNIILTKWSK